MKCTAFTDIHYGLKNNSDDYNSLCNQFIDFMIKQTPNIDTCIYLGDWHHYRSNIGVNTLCASIEGLKKISNAYKKVYFLIGNHDMFYKNRLDIHSLKFGELFPNVEVITKPTLIDKNILLLPWLIDDDKLSNYNAEFIFAHAEIPSFNFNKKIKMDGLYNPEDYQKVKKIYSGHFHLRQLKNNIQYIGNCFSHDFSDVDDYHNKGFMVFDSNGQSEDEINKFYEWEEAPKYLIVKSSELKNIKLPTNSSIKIVNDENKTSRQMLKIQTEVQDKFNLKNCSIIPTELDVSTSISEPTSINKACQTLDITILEMLKEVHYENIDNELLQELYRCLN